MNEQKKTEIMRLGQNGLGYKKIAAILSLSTNTVKSFCRRKEIEKKESEPKDNEGSVCLLCKEKSIHIKGKRKKKYCGKTCRMKWWHTHLDKVNKKSLSLVYS